MAGALVMLQREWAMGDLPRSFLPWAVLIVPWPLGAALDRIDWTHSAGAPVQVAVIQGAIPQDQKWVAANLEVTITRYRDLTLRSLGVPLIVWPEAAIPDLANNHIPLLRSLAQQTEVHGSSLLIGLIRSEVLEKGAEPLYFNSILALGEDPQFYDKHHLVPFAEFFPVPAPVRRWLRLMSLPYSDFTAGAARQPPLRIAGLVLEASICYEDGYASSRLPVLEEATALVNVTNDAWFGRSPARYQHLQISRMRAQEARRFMIRAANDGVSAVIGPRGELVATAPEYRAAVLRAAIEPRSGLPPYARTGNLPLIVFSASQPRCGVGRAGLHRLSAAGLHRRLLRCRPSGHAIGCRRTARDTRRPRPNDVAGLRLSGAAARPSRGQYLHQGQAGAVAWSWHGPGRPDVGVLPPLRSARDARDARRAAWAGPAWRSALVAGQR